MKLGLFVHANFLPLKVLTRQLSAVAKVCGRAQLTLDYPNGFENIKQLAANPLARDIQWTLHAPFTYVDCMALDEGYRKLSITRVGQALEFARQLDCPNLVLHAGKAINAVRESAKTRKLACESLGKISERGTGAGIRILFENMPPGGWHSGYPQTLNEIRAVSLGSPNVGLCLDIGHATRSGIALNELLPAMGKKIFNMHLHDATREKDHLPIGKGTIDFLKLRTQLEKIGYSGGVDIELVDFNQQLISLKKLEELGY